MDKVIPELVCVKKPSKGKNDGIYEVIIPFEYMLVREKASSYKFIFKGMREKK